MNPHSSGSLLLSLSLLWSVGLVPTEVLAAGAPPTITAQPQPQTVFPGVNVNLRVAAVPPVGLQYQWRFFGTNLPDNAPGQFTPVLTLPEVATDASGPYSVVVSNRFGAVTSAVAAVTVNAPSGTAVGYINLTATPGVSLWSHPLIPALTNQTVAGQLPFVNDGVSLFKVDGNGFRANNYLDGWSDGDMTLTLGEGWFFRNPAPESLLVTLVGGVISGRVINRLPAGHSICANIIPQAGRLSSELGFPRAAGNKVYQLDRASAAYSYYEANEFEWFPAEPSVGLSEAFWVQGPVAQDWVRDFSISPFSVTTNIYLIVQPALASHAGEINFFTFNPDPTLGRVLDFDGGSPLQSEFAGQLYVAPGNDDDESGFVPIGRPELFLDGAGAGYVRGQSLKVPGRLGGESVRVQLRVWEKCAGRAYEEAVLNGSAAGRSQVVRLVAHAPIENDAPGLPPLSVNTFTSFVIQPGQAAPFRLAQVRRTNSAMEICFTTQPGAIYCLQKAPACAEPMRWVPVPGAERIVGTGHVAKFNDPVAAECFYRLCPAGELGSR